MQIWKHRAAVTALLYFPLIANGQGIEESRALDFMKQSPSQVDFNRISYISQSMHLNSAVAENFWPRYQSYLLKQTKLRDAQLETPTKFAGYLNRDSLNGNAATGLLDDNMTQEKKRLKNRQDFYQELGWSSYSSAEVALVPAWIAPCCPSALWHVGTNSTG